ncbi:hypothetical protein HC928_01795 [bacterium]|nr:hypothetical protein [bacterium]
MAKRTVQHLIQIYVLGSGFYVASMLQQPNVTWLAIEPVYKVSINDFGGLIQAVKKAKLQSRTFSATTSQDEEAIAWDGEGGKVWDTATLLLSIRWYDDDSALIAPQERIPPSDDPEFAGGSGWRRIKGSEKELPAPVSDEAVAQEIMQFAQNPE